MKIYFTLIAIFVLKIALAQDLCGMLSINLDSTTKTYVSVDKKSSNAVVCFIINNRAKAVLLDDKTKFIDSIGTKALPPFSKVIANNTSKNVSKFVFTNDSFSFLSILKFDFNLKKGNYSAILKKNIVINNF